MKKTMGVWAVLTLLGFGLAVVFPARAVAITIKEEQDLSKEFLKVIFSRFEMVDDPIILDYVNKVGQRILSVVPAQPFTYHFYVIKADDFNATRINLLPYLLIEACVTFT